MSLAFEIISALSGEQQNIPTVSILGTTNYVLKLQITKMLIRSESRSNSGLGLNNNNVSVLALSSSILYGNEC